MSASLGNHLRIYANHDVPFSRREKVRRSVEQGPVYGMRP